MATRNAVNLGFNGDATSHLLWRIENGEVAGIAPKVAVILIGANNLGRLHWPAEDTVAGIDAIVTQLRHRLPHTKLLLLGVLPSDRSAWATQTTLAINRALAARYRRGGDVTYLDIGQVFMRNGGLNRELFFDPKLTPPSAPLHPTAEGQALMAEAIEPTLAALLGDKAHMRHGDDGSLSLDPSTTANVPRLRRMGRAQAKPIIRPLYPSASASSSIARLENARMLATRSPLPVSSVMAREKFGPSSPMQVCPAASP